MYPTHDPDADPVLRTYKLNECLATCPPEIGRARSFTRGWFENESIWLHMTYKYLLELLRAGLYQEFFSDAQTMLVPFMNPEVYGRSILENSSFLASSANPDARTHGRGFIARLSGSTAEFIDIWLLLTVGPEPFVVEGGELCFRLQPVLPGSWFTTRPTLAAAVVPEGQIPANAFACVLLGSILLVYHNKARKDTYGPQGVKPLRYLIDQRDSFAAGKLAGEPAHRIRRRACTRLEVWLG